MYKRLYLVFFIILFAAQISAQNLKISARLGRKTILNPEKIAVWIYFTDKGSLQKRNANSHSKLISERSVKRREKVVENGSLYDQLDLPVYKRYSEKIEKYLIKKRVESRWLNAISADVTAENIAKIAKLPFVDKVDIVTAFKRSGQLNEYDNYDLKRIDAESPDDSLGYLKQIQQIKVDKLHEKGSCGQGVLICMLDDGFCLYRKHEVYESLDVLKTWDFINGDSTVDEVGYYGEGSHGSMTLSSIGAYAPGKLIGTAYKATFMLGKTEIDSAEKPIEEDYWVAGLEWADAEGADIVSSSLGYIDWYTWHDMDGETAVTTKATKIAEKKGLLVVNSAGNEYSCDSCNTLIAPADGEFVLTVGAVDSTGSRVSFSSVGLTADGRIKPDVMAMGLNVTVASYTDPHSYRFANGTSFSCPLTAGAAALLIERNPSVTPQEIREALRKTASRAENPDRFYGWGVINADSAAQYLEITMNNGHKVSFDTYLLSQNYPNPFNPSTKISFYLPQNDYINLEIFNILGERVRTLAAGYFKKNSYSFTWNGKNEQTVLLSSGVYIYVLRTSKTILSKKMILLR